jgi:hypothetical protein
LEITTCGPPEIHRSAGKAIPLGFQEASIDLWVFNAISAAVFLMRENQFMRLNFTSEILTQF